MDTVITATHGDNEVKITNTNGMYEIFTKDSYIGETSDFMKAMNICIAILNSKDGNWEILTTMRV